MAQLMMMKVAYRNLVSILLLVTLASSCSVSKQINKQASRILFTDSTINTGFMGISIYDVAAGEYLYNYNATKYFVPASNTKLFSLYAGMKYLGDSLVGLKYQLINDSSINIFPTGDPTFLHTDFAKQPVIDFLNKGNKRKYVANNWTEQALGYGWSWDDYNENYMVERGPMPILGNIVKFTIIEQNLVDSFSWRLQWHAEPELFKDSIQVCYTQPVDVNNNSGDSVLKSKESPHLYIRRNINDNKFTLDDSKSAFSKQEIPYHVNGIGGAIQILNSALHYDLKEATMPSSFPIKSIHSQPSDSLFTPMMHRSDNFFAEQTLLMASNERLGYMKDEDIIDTLLNTDLKDIPQRPQWVDGSGLSRYNLFTPQDFIFILNKLKNDFGLERVKKILPTGGTGTLKRYFNSDSGFIFAKTGTLSNHVALSGYLITKKNKLLLFSILNNNYEGSSTPIRRAVERFLQQLREKY